MSMEPRPNYYEVLQVSPRASVLVISKAYRVLVALYHPDNQDTGDETMFRLVVEAARVLTDPVSRTAYDAGRLEEIGAAAGLVDEAPEPGPPTDEPARRAVLLEALYNVRRSCPERPSVPIRVIPELLGGTMAQAQFTLWYLRGKKFIESTDDGWAITVAGVDYLEATRGVPRGSTGSLPALEPHEHVLEAPRP